MVGPSCGCISETHDGLTSPKPELIEYYTGYGFQSVRMNESGTLMMMVCLLRSQFSWEPEQLS